MAAVAFGNSTGLPLTLIKIIHRTAGATSGLSKVDPSIFVSIYLLVYPILQWGIGGWLLQPPDLSVYDAPSSLLLADDYLTKIELEKSEDGLGSNSNGYLMLSAGIPGSAANAGILDRARAICTPERIEKAKSVAVLVWTQFAQPPVIASLAGLFIACIDPLHAVLVDTKDRDGDSPLGWLFDGLYVVGQAAIPINMFMLGSTLCQGVASVPADFRWAPNLAVAFGKLVIMPTIGLVSVLLLHAMIPTRGEVTQSMFFAMLIVTCSPTANNINVMAEVRYIAILVQSI